jgi:hypothetical protein
LDDHYIQQLTVVGEDPKVRIDQKELN